MNSLYLIDFAWDDEARVWIASSPDVKGFFLEHGSFDALCERVRIALPDFLNEVPTTTKDIFLKYQISRQDKLVLYG